MNTAKPRTGLVVDQAVAVEDSLRVVITGRRSRQEHRDRAAAGRLGIIAGRKLAQLRAYCGRNAKPFSTPTYDALKDEQAQGITIGRSRVLRSRSEKIVIDARTH
jgi:hypothetical protein